MIKNICIIDKFLGGTSERLHMIGEKKNSESRKKKEKRKKRQYHQLTQLIKGQFKRKKNESSLCSHHQ